MSTKKSTIRSTVLLFTALNVWIILFGLATPVKSHVRSVGWVDVSDASAVDPVPSGTVPLGVRVAPPGRSAGVALPVVVPQQRIETRATRRRAGTETKIGGLSCTAPERIMPLGDSITYGWFGSDVDTRPPEEITGYRQPLYLTLTNDGYQIDFVGALQTGQAATPAFDPDHQGPKGVQAEDVADQVYGWLAENPADVVLLHIGTNDIGYAEPVMEVVSDVEDILDEIDRFEANTGHHVMVILARIINRTNDKNKQDNTTDYNNSLTTMAEDRTASGDDIVVVDHESALTYEIGVDMANDVHPNDSGYKKMADVWKAPLTKILACGPTEATLRYHLPLIER